MGKIVLLLFFAVAVSCTKNNQNNIAEEIDIKNTMPEKVDSKNAEANTFTAMPEKIMYVVSKEGLRQRLKPSITGTVMETLLYGERIIVYAKTNSTETIDGLTDYWYSTNYNNESWVFGGYVSEKFPSDAPVVLGLWDDISNKRHYIQFNPNQKYANGLKESDVGVWGSWDLHGDVITINLTSTLDEEIDETFDVQLTVIDQNNIILEFPNNNITELSRSADVW